MTCNIIEINLSNITTHNEYYIWIMKINFIKNFKLTNSIYVYCVGHWLVNLLNRVSQEKKKKNTK